MVIFWILGSTLLISLISLIGIISLIFKEKFLEKILLFLVGFAAGGLIGGSFLHLLPEAFEKGENISWYFVIAGFVFFFLLERYLYWRHCHDGVCYIHTFTYLNLVGDGIHNFCDGLLIAVSYAANIHLGIITTLAVIFHEIPQEIGDFGILVYGGFSKTKAMWFNFLSAIMCILGAILGYLITGWVENIAVFLIPFTAGGFIYIASSDLLPELHKQKDIKKSNIALITFILGLLFMGWLKLLIKE
ncbi:MAG: ZIP family metal transporter [Candidatus Omnitrophica bacterium]|nr:ZIP family metal transporter [Candidatus Omnitrophota bacterium]